MIYPGTANTELMKAYFEEVLPKLQKPSVIIMDNAPFHKSMGLQEVFNKYNHQLVFLPPYSPTLNPIENMWGTIKERLRNHYDKTKSLVENLSYWICQYSE